ncbi:MAG: alpha/beta hydrolase [Fuerstiella sp.]|nr:alpha/beta hydrolase [Fuerstiella sp.]
MSTPALANLILAAPDVDTQEFDVLAGSIRHVAGKITLYASDTDFALEASKKVHGGAFRAGDSRATVSVAGLQTIRVSGVSAGDPLGHSYYGSNTTVLTQLSRLLRPPVQLSNPLGASDGGGSLFPIQDDEDR